VPGLQPSWFVQLDTWASPQAGISRAFGAYGAQSQYFHQQQQQVNRSSESPIKYERFPQGLKRVMKKCLAGKKAYLGG